MEKDKISLISKGFKSETVKRCLVTGYKFGRLDFIVWIPFAFAPMLMPNNEVEEDALAPNNIVLDNCFEIDGRFLKIIKKL